MGKISQGILGAVSGKVGNVIGASWKGIAYVRIKPASVANPRTEGQVNQRNKFTATLQFVKGNQAFIKQGFKAHQSRQSAFNAAMSYNIRNAITGTAPDFAIDYSAAMVSRGSLTGASEANAELVGNQVNFSWMDNSAEGNARPDDHALLLVYSQEKMASVAVLEEGIRRDGLTGTAQVPSEFSGDTVHFYLAFQTSDGSAVSNSGYLGSAVVA